MRYDIDAETKRRLRANLRNIPELTEGDVEQMVAFASSVVAGRVEVIEVPPTQYESRFTSSPRI
jgi:hypothetical protein